MALLTLGAGATLKSTTLEAALHELATFIKINERIPSKNLTTQDNFSISWSSRTLQFTSSFVLPCTFLRNENGIFVPRCINYFTDVIYESGTTAGDLVSDNPQQDFMDLVLMLQDIETDISRNPTEKNYISGEVLNEPYRFEGSYTLDCTEIINVNGSPSYPIKPYLT